MTVKCVYILVDTDLSTPKFLEALQQFIARRGIPRHIYADNGIYFQGTCNFFIKLRSNPLLLVKKLFGQ